MRIPISMTMGSPAWIGRSRGWAWGIAPQGPGATIVSKDKPAAPGSRPLGGGPPRRLLDRPQLLDPRRGRQQLRPLVRGELVQRLLHRLVDAHSHAGRLEADPLLHQRGLTQELREPALHA